MEPTTGVYLVRLNNGNHYIIDFDRKVWTWKEETLSKSLEELAKEPDGSLPSFKYVANYEQVNAHWNPLTRTYDTYPPMNQPLKVYYSPTWHLYRGVLPDGSVTHAYSHLEDLLSTDVSISGLTVDTLANYQYTLLYTLSPALKPLQAIRSQKGNYRVYDPNTNLYTIWCLTLCEALSTTPDKERPRPLEGTVLTKQQITDTLQAELQKVRDTLASQF